jgi:hypothetical protein
MPAVNLNFKKYFYAFIPCEYLLTAASSSLVLHKYKDNLFLLFLDTCSERAGHIWC